jgi:hypothetical protein
LNPVNGQTANDLARGRSDIEFFASRWLGIKGNPGQVAWWKACADRAEDGFRPRYLTTVVSAGNRAGKTLAMAVVCLHHALYKLGIRPPEKGNSSDAGRWINDPYEWYHVGIQQETAELVHREISMILQGGHQAQANRGCPLTSELGKIADFEKKYRGEYLWIKFSPIVGGASIHFRTTQDKAKALLGKDMQGISFDEAAFEPHLVTIYQEVLNLRRLSTGGPLHFIGTPTEGHNDYSDLWEMGNPENPNRDDQFISFRLSTRDNIGFGLRQEDFDAVVRQQAEYLIPQNIDGHFIESRTAFFSSQGIEASFDTTLELEDAPKSAHRYVQGCDPGISSDATWALTIDITSRSSIRGVRARKRGGKQTITAVVNMVREGHLLYNSGAQCTTIVDSTGMGGKLFREEFSIIKPLRDFDFGGTKSKKLELLNDLKTVIDKGQVKFPRGGVWEDLRRQLLAYKLEDKKLEQDAVMALAIAVRYAIRNPEKAAANVAFSYFGAAE